MTTATEKFSGITGGVTDGRIQNLKQDAKSRKLELAAYDIVECTDEHTGRKFGNRVCRRGYAVKLGGGGRNRTSTVRAYQVWAVVKKEYRK